MRILYGCAASTYYSGFVFQNIALTLLVFVVVLSRGVSTLSVFSMLVVGLWLIVVGRRALRSHSWFVESIECDDQNERMVITSRVWMTKSVRTTMPFGQYSFELRSTRSRSTTSGANAAYIECRDLHDKATVFIFRAHVATVGQFFTAARILNEHSSNSDRQKVNIEKTIEGRYNSARPSLFHVP